MHLDHVERGTDASARGARLWRIRTRARWTIRTSQKLERLFALLMAKCRCALTVFAHERTDLGRASGGQRKPGETRYRVRGDRIIDTNTGETSFRVRDDGRLVDADSGQTRFRVRDDGRVADANTGETIYRLRG